MLCLKLCLAGTASDSIRYNTSIRDLSSSNRGRLLNQVCSSFEDPNPLKDDERLVVLTVAELSFR